jgi:hypothetical protein
LVYRFIIINNKNAMKILSYVLVVLVITASVFYYGCDDAGKIPVEELAGQVKFTQNVKLLPLDPVNDGMYNLWLILTDTLGVPRPSHLGRFNVLTSGQIVDVSGNPLTLTVNPNDTIDLPRTLYSIISIDVGVVGQPGPTRILAGPVTIHPDSITARLLVTDTLAIGSAMTAALGPNSVFYIINAPTGLPGNCSKGLWFCDQDGLPSWSVGSALNPGWGWIYKGWVRNKSTNEVYPSGSFYDPDGQDSDGPGPCADTNGTAYIRPGQDWVLSGCSTISNIADGNHETFVTLEPEFRAAGLPPFVLKLYYQNSIVTSVGCNRRDNMFTQRQNIPDVSLRVTR